MVMFSLRHAFIYNICALFLGQIQFRFMSLNTSRDRERKIQQLTWQCILKGSRGGCCGICMNTPGALPLQKIYRCDLRS